MTRAADEPPARGYRPDMKLMRAAAVAGIAKTVYTQARKPENQVWHQGRDRPGAVIARARDEGARAHSSLPLREQLSAAGRSRFDEPVMRSSNR